MVVLPTPSLGPENTTTRPVGRDCVERVCGACVGTGAGIGAGVVTAAGGANAGGENGGGAAAGGEKAGGENGGGT
ncbi:MAG: hypothetical protein KGL53_05410, partial [Elusimicrobia bacterium]|nr:hypothetical protein [Elusimicrobiota bacterium]